MERAVIGYGLASTDRSACCIPRSRRRRSRRGRRSASASQRENLAAFVELFDRDAYFANMSVAENMLFGTPRHPDFQPGSAREQSRRSSRCCATSGCSTTCYAAGAKVAALMVEIFADVAPDSDLFEQYSFISPEDLPEFQALVSKFNKGKMAAISGARQGAPARADVPAGQVAAPARRHGRRDAARASSRRAQEFSRRYAGRDDICEFFQPDRFSAALSIQDNILFGRVAFDQANAQARISAMVRDIATEEGLNDDLVRLGLEFDVGSSGSRLSYSERQRLAIARGLMKNPDILVFNEPTSGLDPATEAARAARRARMGEGPDGAVGAVARRARARIRPRARVRRRPARRGGLFEELERGGKALRQSGGDQVREPRATRAGCLEEVSCLDEATAFDPLRPLSPTKTGRPTLRFGGGGTPSAGTDGQAPDPVSIYGVNSINIRIVSTFRPSSRIAFWPSSDRSNS